MLLRRAADLLRRCASAATWPLLVLSALVVVDVAVVDAPPPEARDDVALGRARVAVAALVLLWLTARAAWAALQPGRDRAAAARLALLHDGATTPGCALVQITDITWTAAAGTRATCVDVNMGLTHDLWFPETSLAIGAFVLVRLDRYIAHPVDTLDPRHVAAAHRHQLRHGQDVAGEPVAEAERLLRQAG
jgi:hypothetical protein